MQPANTGQEAVASNGIPLDTRNIGPAGPSGRTSNHQLVSDYSARNSQCGDRDEEEDQVRATVNFEACGQGPRIVMDGKFNISVKRIETQVSSRETSNMREREKVVTA